jgi:hypothetical protein
MKTPRLRSRLDVESLERRDTPSSLPIAPHAVHPLELVHGTIQLTPAAAAPAVANGATTITGTATINSHRLGQLTGTFTEKIGPHHRHGSVKLDVTGNGDKLHMQFLENFSAQVTNGSAKTHGNYTLRESGPLVAAHSTGVVNGTVNVTTGAGTLNFTGLIRL